MWSYLRYRVVSSLLRTTQLNDKKTIARNTKNKFGDLTKPPANECIQYVFKSSDQEHGEGEGGKQGHRKRTCDEQREYYPHHECSLLETVGWVGTALALGLNFRLCNGNRVKPVERDPKCPQPFLCKKVRGLLWGLVSALPGKSKNIAPKLAIPDSQRTTPQTTSDNCNNETDPVQIKQQRVLESLEATRKELELISQEYFGQLETIAGLEAIDLDSRKGLTHFQEGGRLGNAKSHFNLGVCYETGRGTEIDLEKAAHHFQMASNADHPMALYNLGVYYLEGRGNLPQDYEKGLKLIDKAAKLNVPEAITHMGIHYFEQSQWNLAFPLLLDASSKDPEAQYYLAYCYKNGLGVSVNPELAEKYFKMASESGFEETIDEELLSSLKVNNLRIPNSNSSLHSSSSNPELNPRTNDPLELKNPREIAISRYLDIILPNVNPIVNFKIGDDYVNNYEYEYDFNIENQLELLPFSDSFNVKLRKVSNVMMVQ